MTGAGKFFCAGGDLKSFAAKPTPICRATSKK